MKSPFPFLFPVQILLLCLLCGPAAAQEPKVRTSLPGQGDLWVGQRISLIVELLVPGFFSGTAAFDVPDPAGLLLIPPASTPVVSSEEIDGVAYSVQRHELSIFARRPGERAIPAFPVRFAFKRQPLDKDSVPAAEMTEPITFTARLPPGAEGLGSLISARNLKISESWHPEPGEAAVKAGSAFTRTITFSAPEIPAMAFPPFPSGKIDGLGIYPKAPEVLDKSERGVLTGTRRDSVTYVCQRAGEFTIPATRLTWYDLEAASLRTVDLPARRLNVTANPEAATVATAPPLSGWDALRASGTFKAVLGTVAGMAGLSALAWFSRKWPPCLRGREKILRFARSFRAVRLERLNPSSREGKPPQRGRG